MDSGNGTGSDAGAGEADSGAGRPGDEPRIRALSEEAVRRIAAGEVVERPASVVKELVENSLDADASRVRVAVDGDGTDRVLVRDDGVGMTPPELALAVEEHTTSKLRDAGELDAGVSTLGFRGEALHTIGAVSRLAVRSKPRGADGAGARVRVEGGDVADVEPVGCPEGTAVEVEDLFFNTPARRKFLKTPATEFDHVNTVVTQYALANPDVAVTLEHDDRETFSTEGRGSLPSTVLSVYGREVAESMVEVEAGTDAGAGAGTGTETGTETEAGTGGPSPPRDGGAVESVHGLVSHPETTRAGREYLSTFVNGRYVTAAPLREAVLDAYGGQLAPDRYPFAVLFVDVPPGAVDVNVHPRKMEVRFDDEAGVREAVEAAVRDALLSAGLVRSSAPRGRSAPAETEVRPESAGSGSGSESEPDSTPGPRDDDPDAVDAADASDGGSGSTPGADAAGGDGAGTTATPARGSDDADPARPEDADSSARSGTASASDSDSDSDSTPASAGPGPDPAPSADRGDAGDGGAPDGAAGGAGAEDARGDGAEGSNPDVTRARSVDPAEADAAPGGGAGTGAGTPPTADRRDGAGRTGPAEPPDDAGSDSGSGDDPPESGFVPASDVADAADAADATDAADAADAPDAARSRGPDADVVTGDVADVAPSAREGRDDGGDEDGTSPDRRMGRLRGPTTQRTLDGGEADGRREFDRLPAMRVLGQLHDTYVVAETDDGLVLVDQHAADERVNYERLRAATAGEPATQALAAPVELELTAREAALFAAHREALAELGFRAAFADGDGADGDGADGEPEGGRRVAVRSVPAVLSDALDPDLLRDVLRAFVADDVGPEATLDAVADSLLADLACHPSVTGNTSLHEGSVTALLSALDDCENPYACPHGRPTVVSVDASELDERFERDYPGHAGRRRE